MFRFYYGRSVDTEVPSIVVIVLADRVREPQRYYEHLRKHGVNFSDLIIAITVSAFINQLTELCISRLSCPVHVMGFHETNTMWQIA